MVILNFHSPLLSQQIQFTLFLRPSKHCIKHGHTFSHYGWSFPPLWLPIASHRVSSLVNTAARLDDSWFISRLAPGDPLCRREDIVLPLKPWSVCYRAMHHSNLSGSILFHGWGQECVWKSVSECEHLGCLIALITPTRRECDYLLIFGLPIAYLDLNLEYLISLRLCMYANYT